MSILKETDWIMPKDMETPCGPDSGPLMYRIFKRQESITKEVYVSYFVNKLAEIMKDFEKNMSIYWKVPCI